MIFERIGEGIKKSDITKDIEIALNKRMSRIMSEVKSETKGDVCFFVGSLLLVFVILIMFLDFASKALVLMEK